MQWVSIRRGYNITLWCWYEASRLPWWSLSFPLIWFEFPCLVTVSLLPPAFSCTLQPPAALPLVRIPPCLYPSPLEHGSRQWGDRHNRQHTSTNVGLCICHNCHLRVATKLSHDHSNSDLYAASSRLKYHAVEIGKYLMILLLRYSIFSVHVL